MQFTRYNTSTGRVLCHMECPADLIAEQCQPGEGWTVGHLDGDAVYVVDGTPTQRPAMPIALDKNAVVATGFDVATFSNIPRGATVAIDGPNMNGAPLPMLDSPTLEFDAIGPGRFVFRFACWPMADAEFVIDAS